MTETPITSELMIFTGNVGAPDFPDWIVHRARRLGLKGWVKNSSGGSIEVLVIGPPDLVDAMELGCSLGPMSVRVETIERRPHSIDRVPNGFHRLPTGS